MDDWFLLGCPICRKGVLESGDQPRRIAVWVEGPEFLHQCDECGAYWRFTLRSAYVISTGEARSDFPNAFVSKDN